MGTAGVPAAVSDVVHGPVADIVCPIALSYCREVASADPITLVQERTCLRSSNEATPGNVVIQVWYGYKPSF